jgi:phage shock protein C
MATIDAQPPPPANSPGGPLPPPVPGEQGSARSGPEQPGATRPARLTRSRDERMVGGVASGIAAYLGIDPVLVRLAFVVLALAGGGGVLAYLVAWIVIPEQPDGPQQMVARTSEQATTMRAIAGGVLVILGAGWLLHELVPGIARVTLPLTLILVGVVVVVAGLASDRNGGAT